MNETIETILKRSSVREYSEKEISEVDLNLILKAGMSGPTCVNARDYSFIIVRDKEMLERMADANGAPAQPLRNANLGILICGDMNRAFKGAPDYFVIDCAVAAQNMIIAATSMGIGSVWLGTWPQKERVENLQKLFCLPETIIPHTIISFGYPLNDLKGKDHWEDDRIHYEKW